MKLSILAGLIAAGMFCPAYAQEKPAGFPGKPVELLTYTDPGTSIDLTLRALSPLLSKAYDQPVVTVNRPGGNGVNAMSYLMRRPADGYLLYGHTTTFSSVMAQQVGGFTGEEVDYLCNIVQEPQAVTVRAESQFKTLEELVAYAKANPGKLRVSGGAGASAYNRLFAIAFQDAAKIEMTWVPFDSSPEGRRALMAGDVDLLFTSVGGVEGARMLAVTSADRFRLVPEVPTTKELGYDIGDLAAWRGIFVKRGVPEDVKQYLIWSIRTATEQPEWKAFIGKIGADSRVTCASEFFDQVKAEIETTRTRYKALGIIQ
ncbi:MAG: tripartite tricarboxylate transporter substrate binding protein [Phyllobacterium sp.]